MRSLSPEESALWARVASTIRPLSRDGKDQEVADATPIPEQPKPVALRPAYRLAAPPEQRRPGTTLDGTWDWRLRSGTLEPDRVVDLHGMSLDGAWRAIDRSLDHAISRGDRVILLITGHQRSGEAPIRRGAIRAAVHDWLDVSRHAKNIAAVRAAHQRHGGGGSLYIVLRRSRQRTVY